jgi:hypothetical protein
MARKRKPNKDDRSMSPLLGVPARGVIPPRVFRSMYPLSYALGLRPVSVNGNEHEGFDIDEVEKKTGCGPIRVSPGWAEGSVLLRSSHWPADHPEQLRRNCEVHCVYARDLEVFLKNVKTLRKRN